MGNRGVLRAVNNIARGALPGPTFGQIILAAADVDADAFRNLCSSYVASSLQTTLYVSARDRAVEAAQWLHDFARAGLTPPVMIMPGINTVSVTDTDLTMLGHGYVGNARGVLQDIHDLIVWNAIPDLRFGLREDVTGTGERFWRIGR
jgi:esterase/lipase superfamily enzyme